MRARALLSVVAALLLLPATAWAQDTDVENICHHDPTNDVCLEDEGDVGGDHVDAPGDGTPEEGTPDEVDVAVLGTQLDAGPAQLAMTGTNALIASAAAFGLLLAGGVLLRTGRRRPLSAE